MYLYFIGVYSFIVQIQPARSVAELKQLVEKPEVVEAWDVTAHDPRLLVHLKGALLLHSSTLNV